MKINRLILAVILVLSGSILYAPASSAHKANEPVTLKDDGATYIVANGIITAQIEKSSGAVISLKYKGLELLGKGQGRSNGYWSLPGSSLEFGSRWEATVRQDPAGNKGERAAVSCKFYYDGKRETVPADVEVQYTLERGASALYLQANWEHKPEYPALSFGVGRFAAKLNDDVFDWMTVDARRSLQMITAYDWNHGTTLNMKEARRMNSGVLKGQVEHKYDYAAVQFDTPAYGWSSTKQHIGIWMVTASNEYMSGGPTKLELSAHRDATFTDSLTAPAPATLLNVWKGPHYGGTVLEVAAGEAWSKVIGPFQLYCNSGPTHAAMWQDALAQARREARRWPYAWAGNADYPLTARRGGARGQIVLRDPQAPRAQMSHLLVGLTHADYPARNGETVDWQRDGKYYQYWARGDAQGRFHIPDARPGTYTLRAFADGVLGEYAQSEVTVTAGQTLNLGALTWTPVRYGRQLWDIGIPDRTAGEFRHGDRYWQWGLYNLYPKEFPADVRFVIGPSDYRRDWNIMQVPRARDDSGQGTGTATTWSVVFNLAQAPRGRATLRLAFAGTEARNLSVSVNDRAVGQVMGLPNTGVIHRDANRGYWQERTVAFDASMMKAGTNVLQLTVPAGNVMSGVMYDYLRLELNETEVK